MGKWRCIVCGYVHTGEEPPEKCPVCGVPKYKFGKNIEEKTEEKTVEQTGIPQGEWKCSNCGYALRASVPPDICPGCKEKCRFIDVTCYIPECSGRNLNI